MDERDIVDRLEYPASHANKAPLMREAASYIRSLRKLVQELGENPGALRHRPNNVVTLPRD